MDGCKGHLNTLTKRKGNRIDKARLHFLPQTLSNSGADLLITLRVPVARDQPPMKQVRTGRRHAATPPVPYLVVGTSGGGWLGLMLAGAWLQHPPTGWDSRWHPGTGEVWAWAGTQSHWGTLAQT